MAKKVVIHAFSAGGVVFRGGASDPPGHASKVEIALVGHLRENVWTLPKGTPALGETREQTALREVREETGLEVIIVGEVGSIEYTFSRRGARFIKRVFHYLMLATGGDVALHDHEYDEARWFPLAEALRALTYENESEIVRRAEPLIQAYLSSGA